MTLSLWIPNRYCEAPLFEVAPAVTRAALAANVAAVPQAALTADARGVPLKPGEYVDIGGRNWQGFGHRIQRQHDKLTADAAVRGVVATHRGLVPRARRMADATMHNPMELVEMRAQLVEAQILPRQLITQIPEQSVPLNKDTFALTYVESVASVEVRTSGKTTMPFGSSRKTHGWSGMHVFHTGTKGRDWRQRQLQASDDDDARAARVAVETIDTFLSRTWLVSGASGLDSLHLVNLPVSRYTSTNVIGTTAVDTVDVEIAAFLHSLTDVQRGLSINGKLVLITTSRIVARLGMYANFAVGGPGMRGPAAVRELFAAMGYEVRISDELRDVGGTSVDGMLAFVEYDDGLKQLVSMPTGPSDSWTLGSIQYTEYAAIHGGLICPDKSSCRIGLFPVLPFTGV
jgi:hypothetical protein